MLITTIGRDRGRWVSRVYEGRRLLLVARGGKGCVQDVAGAFCAAWLAQAKKERADREHSRRTGPPSQRGLKPPAQG